MSENYGGSSTIERWLRNKDTLEFLGIWELINNEDFNSPEFEGIKNQAGNNRFTISVKQWVSKTGAIGIKAKTGKYNAGTYAHKDIAFEFGSWLSPEFKLYLIKEFQRLKEEEAKGLNQAWDLERYLTKVNYRIHTDAEEADILNQAVFGMTAAEWRKQNPLLTGNIRDHAYLEQLIVLRNIESMSAMLISDGLNSGERLTKLNEYAIKQMKSLLQSKKLPKDKSKFEKALDRALPPINLSEPL